MFVGWLAIDPDAIKSVVGCAALILFTLHLSFLGERIAIPILPCWFYFHTEDNGGFK